MEKKRLQEGGQCLHRRGQAEQERILLVKEKWIRGINVEGRARSLFFLEGASFTLEKAGRKKRKFSSGRQCPRGERFHPAKGAHPVQREGIQLILS